MTREFRPPTKQGSGVHVRDMVVKVADGRSSRVIIDRLSFDASPGELTALVGPSGCGKTTVLSCLAGVAKFQSGRAVVGRQARRPDTLASAEELREVGMIFQDYRLVKSLNVVDNVALTLRLTGESWPRARKRAAFVLEQLGLGDRLRNRPSSLSGGEQQRVAFARAAIGEPEVLLADEPSAHLDKESAELMLSFFLGMALDGVCLVLTTHDRRLLDHCHRIVTLG